MELIGMAEGQLVLLLPCTDPGLVRDGAPLPWSGALGCCKAAGIGKLQTDIVRCLGLGVLL